MTRVELLAHLGPPDETGAISTKTRLPQILYYNKLEFHFGPGEDSGLRLIYRDDDDGVVHTCIHGDRNSN